MTKIVVYDPSFQLVCDFSPLRSVVREIPNGTPVGVPGPMPSIGPEKMGWFARLYYKLIKSKVVTENYFQRHNDQDIFNARLAERRKADVELQAAIEAAKDAALKFKSLPKDFRQRRSYGICITCNSEDFLYYGKRCNQCHRLNVTKHIAMVRETLARRATA